MPLVEQKIYPGRVWGLWKIEETEDILYPVVKAYEVIPDTLTHHHKRLEFIAGRVLISKMMSLLGLDFRGISKNKHGKPHLKNHPHHISLSHSYPYVTALIDANITVGIDLEQIKDKLLAIAPRVLHETERMDAGENISKHCIYWCAKEAMVKIHGEKNLTFAENLLVEPFSMEKDGDLIGRIIVNTSETTYPLRYRLMNDFAMVYNT